MIADVQMHKGYTKVLLIREMDTGTRLQAERKFAEYAAKGVIDRGSFPDAEWRITDEVKRRNIRFETGGGTVQEWAGCDEGCFLDYVKSYTVLLLGTMAASSVAGVSSSLVRLGCCGFGEACTWDVHISHALQFLGMIPDSPGYIGAVMERIEENRTLDGWARKPRKLADFRYYLRFDRYVNEFWGTAGEDTKDYFFPVYLWWRLTSILPLRATEFLLLPGDCIHNRDGRWILTVRRTRLKKRQQKVGYTIHADYTLHEYEVPEWLAGEILAYKAAGEKRRPHEKDTLFSPARATQLGYMTYCQMRRRLGEFKEKVTGSADYPVSLGDTRHLAMINLILSGGSPVVCRELAGHESIDISASYYANLSAVVESAVYEKYRENRGKVTLDGSLKLRMGDRHGMTEVEGGHCDYAGLPGGDISECMKNYREGGHFGDCRNCIHYYPDQDGLRLAVQEGFREKVDEDGMFLMEMIEQVRRGNGAQEDITSALLRLQNSSACYRKALERKMEGEKNGKTKQDR